MTSKEAIVYLKWIRPVRPYSLDKIKVQESIDLAIKALEDKSYAMGYQDGLEDGLDGITPQDKCNNCYYYSFSQAFINGIVEIINKNGLKDVDELLEILKKGGTK